jgi:hypothetical protein
VSVSLLDRWLHRLLYNDWLPGPGELCLFWMNPHVFGRRFLVLHVALSGLVPVSARVLDLCSPIVNTNF